MGQTNFTVSLNPTTKKRLEEMSHRTGTSQSEVIEESLLLTLPTLETEFRSIGEILRRAFGGANPNRLSSKGHEPSKPENNEDEEEQDEEKPKRIP